MTSTTPTLDPRAEEVAGITGSARYYAPRLRAAIVGTGGIARIHGWRSQDLGSDVVAVAGRRQEAAVQLAADLQRHDSAPVHAFDDIERMLDLTRPDVLHVCSPHGFHADHAIAALRRGISVVCEKPLAVSSADAQRMIDARDASGAHAAVCLTKRYYPMVAQLRADVRDGAVGAVHSVTGGFFSWDANHDDWGWGFAPALGGTSYATADLGVHWLDLAEHVVGARIAEVEARFRTNRPVRYLDGHPLPVVSEDYARVLLTFADGTVGTAIFSGVSAGEPNGCRIEVDGTEGSLGWRVDEPDFLHGRTGDGGTRTIRRNPDALAPEAARLAFTPAGHAEGFPEAFRNLIRDVYRAIGAGTPTGYPTFDEGARLVRLVEAIQQSATTRKAVEID